ncbi:integrase, catalytic region, zinc finger, CCHC-type containing protein [Tanacetum coccineum]
MACDVSWKSKLSTLNDENLFNSIKATRTQNQKEVDELIEHINQKAYAYAGVRTQNQDLLMTIYKLKNKLRTIEKGKHVNTKFDKSETLGKLVCVTPFNKNLGNKAKNMSNTKVQADRSKPVTSHPIPKNEQSQKQSANVIAKGMYRITKIETQTPDSKTNIHVSNSASVESSNSVRRPKSKGTKSKNKVLKNTKSSFAYVWKISSNVSIFSNKCETKDSNVCQTTASVSNSMTVNVVNDGLNIVCISCGLLSQEKCIAHYSLSRKSNVKRALFTTPVAAKSKNLGATSVVAKSRLSVAKPPKVTNKVIQLVLWIVDSGCSKHMSGNLQLLRNFIEKFMETVRFGNDHFAAITGYGDYVQGNLTICHVYYVKVLIHNLFSVEQFCDEDLEVAFHSNTCYVQNLKGNDLLTDYRDSNLYIISIFEMTASSPVCLMSRATSTKSWLWHRRFSHLNFGTINQLTSKDLVDGLSKFKYNKDHICSACEKGKRKKASLPPKLIPNKEYKFELLHMDLCRPMRVASINGKKYILVIV